MTGHERALAWRDHLLVGGSTPWSDFHEEPATPTHDPRLPGAQQLELVRRANLAGAPRRLRERILRAGLTGRGLPDLPLTGLPAGGFLAAPTEPTTLDPEELSRVAIGVLADQLLALGPVRPRGQRPSASYVLAGDPFLCDALQRQLRAAGARPSRWRRRVHVLADRPDLMLGHVWLTRCLDHGPAEWSEWVGGLAEAGTLPPRADLADVIARRSREGRIEVVLDPEALGRDLGTPLTAPPMPTLEAVELTRRVSILLGLLAPQARPRLLRTRLLPVLADRGRPIRVDAAHEGWLTGQGTRLRRVAEGYPCHGDPSRLTEPVEPGPDVADEGVVLDLAITAMTSLEEEAT